MWTKRLKRSARRVGEPMEGAAGVPPTGRRRPTASVFQAALAALAVAAASSACQPGDLLIPDEEPAPAAEGVVYIDGVPIDRPAMVRFEDEDMDPDPEDTETLVGGTYRAELTAGVQYHGFPHQVPGTVCPDHRFVARDGVTNLDFDCTTLGGTVVLEYAPVSNTCAIAVEPFNAQYTLIAEVVDGRTTVSLVHTDAPPMLGEYDDRERTLLAATNWIEVPGGGVEIRELVAVDLVYSKNADGTVDSFFQFSGDSILEVRSTVDASQTCSVASSLTIVEDM